MDAFQAE